MALKKRRLFPHTPPLLNPSCNKEEKKYLFQGLYHSIESSPYRIVHSMISVTQQYTALEMFFFFNYNFRKRFSAVQSSCKSFIFKFFLFL